MPLFRHWNGSVAPQVGYWKVPRNSTGKGCCTLKQLEKRSEKARNLLYTISVTLSAFKECDSAASRNQLQDPSFCLRIVFGCFIVPVCVGAAMGAIRQECPTHRARFHWRSESERNFVANAGGSTPAIQQRGSLPPLWIGPDLDEWNRGRHGAHRRYFRYVAAALRFLSNR